MAYKYRTWWIRNVPGKPEYQNFLTLAHAKRYLKVLTERDLKNPHVTSNVGGIQEYINGKWEDMEEEGNNWVSQFRGVF